MGELNRRRLLAAGPATALAMGVGASAGSYPWRHGDAAAAVANARRCAMDPGKLVAASLHGSPRLIFRDAGPAACGGFIVTAHRVVRYAAATAKAKAPAG